MRYLKLIIWVVAMVVVIRAGATTTWNGAIDNNWSTAGNWSAGVPGTDPNAEFASGDAEGVVNVDVATDVQLLTLDNSAVVGFSFSGQAMNLKYVDSNNAIVSQANNQNHVFNNDVSIAGTGYRNISVSSSRVAFSGALIAEQGLQLTGSGEHRINKSLTINNNKDLRVGGGGTVVFNTTQANTINNLVYNGTGTRVVANNADGINFFEGAQILFNADGELELNGANIIGNTSDLRVADGKTATVSFNANEVLDLLRPQGDFVIDLGASVDTVGFSSAASDGSYWTGSVTITNFRSGVVYFGSDASGLTEAELAQITAFDVDGNQLGTLALSDTGALVPEPATLSLLLLSGGMIFGFRRLRAGA